MIKITNGVNVFEVTHGAYEGIYSKQGYIPYVAPAEDNDPEHQDPGKTADELFLEEVVEKPLSQWSKNDVKRYATLCDVDISGTKNVNEAKERIKEHLEAQAQSEE